MVPIYFVLLVCLIGICIGLFCGVFIGGISADLETIKDNQKFQFAMTSQLMREGPIQPSSAHRYMMIRAYEKAIDLTPESEPLLLPRSKDDTFYL
jgi:hypothetical protein